MSNRAAIWFVSAFLSVLAAYTFKDFLWDGGWYHLVAFAFVGYTRTIYLCTTGEWSIMAFIVHLTAVNSFIDELFFNPLEIEANEYIAFLLFIIIAIKNRRKWIRL